MIFLILLMLVLPLSANANEVNIVDENLVCLNATMKFEKEYQIQQHILTTIATVETGRWNEDLQRKIAWPWSVNVKGKSYYYKNKEEAIKAVEKFRNRGFKSIDVGCMQINLVHHGKAFSSLEDAFDPEQNVEYAAKFLTKLHNRRQDWMKAATDYHSKKPSRANKYKTRLMLALIEVEAGHEEIITKYGISSEEPAKIKKNWFARLFWGGNDDNDEPMRISLNGENDES